MKSPIKNWQQKEGESIGSPCPWNDKVVLQVKITTIYGRRLWKPEEKLLFQQQ